MFEICAGETTQTERMWVIVERQEDDGYVGVLDNDPVTTDQMKSGFEIRFEPRHVIDIYEVDESTSKKEQ